MYDCSLLLPARFEFVVVSDTHYMLPAEPEGAEFQSRLVQTARAETALRLAASLKAEFIVHLGDLVQEYPETEAFPRAMDAAVGQLKQCGIVARQVAGNHDVGDKPDPTMPTRPVTPESLAEYHRRFGPSWYSFDREECHFVVVNSQIMNSPLHERDTQRKWLERDLESHSQERIFLFLHLPPYLWDELESALGHYDNLAEPDRSWLLDLVRRYQIELMVAGHVHCGFFDRVESTRYLVVNSTSFTRPGFCHVFASHPPPDRGRDDAPKLGFHLFRVFPDRTDVHFLRTAGELKPPPTGPQQPRRLVTRTSAALPQSPLGLTLRHALSTATEIPLAWPSAIRQRVRNDYPLLSCLELGATSVRTPASDLDDPFQARRLAVLRGEGCRIVATAIWSDDLDVPAFLDRHQTQLDGCELQLAGSPHPSPEQMRILSDCRSANSSVSLSTIIPGEVFAGKQHPRTRHGYRIEELSELNDRLHTAGARVDRVLCRIGSERSPWEDARALSDFAALGQIGTVDCSVELATSDDRVAANRAADALFGMQLLPGSQLYIDPLIDFDRTMDTCHGLLDTLCNPRPAFHVLRCLNSILTAAAESLAADDRFVADSIENGTTHIRILTSADSTRCLLLPQSATATAPVDRFGVWFAKSESIRVFRLSEGTVIDLTPRDAEQALGASNLDGPVLLQGATVS